MNPNNKNSHFLDKILSFNIGRQQAMKENVEIINKAYNFAKDYHSKDTSGHDFEHIKRVYANVCSLLNTKNTQTGCDEFIVKMSAILHDVDDRKLNTDGKNTLRFLESINLEKAKIEQILSTINSTSFSKSGCNPQFETNEMKILSDADKLDAIGAIGICRAIMFGVSKNRSLFDENIFPKSNLTKEEYKNLSRDENNTINHFFDKLLKLKNAMQTDAGKNEAQRRHVFMVDFLKQFFKEQNLENWQEYLENYLCEGKV